MKRINSVLLIDDDPVANSLANQIIKQLNFSREIKTCTDGTRALEYIKEFAYTHNNHSPELILVDLAMSVMDGFQFIEIYNQLEFANRGKVFLVILTSSSDLTNIRRAKKMGVRDYLIKPLTRNAVIQLLQSNQIAV